MTPHPSPAATPSPTRGEGKVRAIAKALSDHGLILRGGFNFTMDEVSPEGRGGRQARSVLLVGQAGAAPWPYFLQWRQTQPTDIADPLDTWSQQIIGKIADQFGARAVSPSDWPYLPFQQWAMRAEGLCPSPLGILMHPEYGLWHAYRGALLFDVELPVTEAKKSIHLCDTCVGKPCMKACPVEAYSGEGFAYERCLAHVRGVEGDTCRSQGCLDRNACPYGIEYRYPASVQAFLMRAFAT